MSNRLGVTRVVPLLRKLRFVSAGAVVLSSVWAGSTKYTSTVLVLARAALMNCSRELVLTGRRSDVMIAAAWRRGLMEVPANTMVCTESSSSVNTDESNVSAASDAAVVCTLTEVGASTVSAVSAFCASTVLAEPIVAIAVRSVSVSVTDTWSGTAFSTRTPALATVLGSAKVADSLKTRVPTEAGSGPKLSVTRMSRRAAATMGNDAES